MCRTNGVLLHVLPETEVHTVDSQQVNAFGGVCFIDFCFSLQLRRSGTTQLQMEQQIAAINV